MKELILKQTKGGLLYFILIFKLLGQKVKITGNSSNKLFNPFYKDTKPSFHLYIGENNDRWNYRDYGNSDFQGDVFSFAGHHYNMDPKTQFEPLMDRMWHDLLKYKNEEAIQKDAIIWNASQGTNETIKKDFELFPIAFSDEGLAFFAQYGISKEILETNRVSEISAYKWVDNSGTKRQHHRKKDELLFAFTGDDFAKIYCPTPKRFLYVGTIPKKYAFGLEEYGSGEIVILTAGEKDVLTLKALGYSAFCLSSETANLSRSIFKEIYQSGAQLMIMYDIDVTGLRESEKLSNEWHSPRIILPKELADKGGKDISDWMKLGLPVETIHRIITEASNSKIIKIEQSPSESMEENNVISENNIEQNSNKANNAISDIELNTNPFPVDVFPSQLQEMVYAAHTHLRYPIDFIAASILCTASAAIGKTHKAKFKEAWQERSLIYMALVGSAGTNKSHPLTFALRPIHDRDGLTYNQYKKDKAKYDEIEAMTPKEKKENGISENLKPIWVRTLVTDITLEALIKVHSQNIKGIAMYVDELAGWIKNFNRYNKGSEKEFWLSNWSGKPITVDRVTSEPILVEDSYVPVFGTIQPYVLEQIGKNELSKNGFIDRILFVIPDNLKKEYLNNTEIDPQIIREWANSISELLNLALDFDENGKVISKTLSFSMEALAVYDKWHRENTDLCNNEENETIKSVYSKLDMYVIRLALILQMLSWACKEGDKKEIELKSMEGAVKLIEYFRKNALKAHSIISNSNPVQKLSSNKRKLYALLPNSFKTGEGVKIAKTIGIPEKTFKNFKDDTNLFEKIDHGVYEKKF